MLGVHFKPGGACPFLGVSAGELAGAHANLVDLWGPSAIQLQERLCCAMTLRERLRAPGRRCPPHLLHLRPWRRGLDGHLPVPRPRPVGQERGRPRVVVAPPRRVPQGLSEVVVVMARSEEEYLLRIGIIGAGAIGGTLARHLAKRGYQVSIANSDRHGPAPRRRSSACGS